MSAKKKKRTRSSNGWTRQKISRVIDYYDHQTEDEASAEIEEGLKEAEAMMQVPRILVPRFRRIIANYESRRSAARRR